MKKIIITVLLLTCSLNVLGIGVLNTLKTSFNALKHKAFTCKTQSNTKLTRISSFLKKSAPSLMGFSGLSYHFHKKFFSWSTPTIDKFDYNEDLQPLYTPLQETSLKRNIAFVVCNREMSLRSLNVYRKDNANAITLESLLYCKKAPILTNRSLFTALHHRHKFNIKECDIYYNNGYFLIIPHEYIKQNGFVHAEELGFNLKKFTKLENPDHVDNYWVPKNLPPEQLNAIIQPELENFETIASELLLPEYNNKKLAWNIGSFGHGNGETSMCGASVDSLKRIFTNYNNNNIPINAWIYKSCYAGGAAIKQQLAELKSPSPFIAVGSRDATVSSKSGYYIDFGQVFSALDEIDTNICCWKEKLAQKVNPIFTYRNSLIKRDTSRDDKSSGHKNLTTKVLTNNTISVRDPHHNSWMIPITPQLVDTTSRRNKHSSFSRAANTPVVIMDTEQHRELILNENQLLVSGLGKKATHQIDTIHIPSIDTILNHFAYTGEHYRSPKQFKINKIIDQQGNILENVIIDLPTYNEKGKIKASEKGETKDFDFEPFELHNNQEYTWKNLDIKRKKASSF
jgi:hypothetical protein